MTNIPYPNCNTLDERVKFVIENAAPLNIVKVMAHAQGNMESVLRLSDSVLNRGVLDPMLRQVALLRLCEVVGSHYEGVLLESISRGVGFDEEMIAAARQGSSSTQLSTLQAMAARLAEELAIAPHPSSPTRAYFDNALGTREFVELVMAIGFYLMQTRLIETFDISPEDPPVDLSSLSGQGNNGRLREWREGRA